MKFRKTLGDALTLTHERLDQPIIQVSINYAPNPYSVTKTSRNRDNNSYNELVF